MRGLPASGKSTKAREIMSQGGDFVRVNLDLMREMLHFSKWSGLNEKITQEMQMFIAEQILLKGKNLIVDDTNLGEKHYNKWKNCADAFGCKFEVVDMNDEVDVYECIERDVERDKYVGRHVILNMAMQYKLLPTLDKIVVVDIDGTVADCKHRLHHVKGEKKDWKGFFSDMEHDTPRREVYLQAEQLAQEEGASIVFVTARPEDYRQVTQKWLHDNRMSAIHMIMRRAGDKRPDTDVKQDILNTYLKHYNIIQVFDDRPVVIQMWRDNGLEVTDVGDGVDF